MRKTAFPEMSFSRRGSSRHDSFSEKGLSLIELLIAMALLSAIAIGVLPLLMRSLADRNRGWEATTVSNFAQSTIEPLVATPYESDSLLVGTGLTEKLTTQSWAAGDPDKVGDDDTDEGWTEDTVNKGNVLWTRNTFVRWYAVTDLDTPLTGDVDLTEVSIKEIQVELTGIREGSLGAGQEMWIRVFQAF